MLSRICSTCCPNSALVLTFRREMPTWSPLRVTVIRYRCAGACGADSRIGDVCQTASSGAVHKNVSAAITRSGSGSGADADIAHTLRTRVLRLRCSPASVHLCPRDPYEEWPDADQGHR